MKNFKELFEECLNERRPYIDTPEEIWQATKDLSFSKMENDLSKRLNIPIITLKPQFGSGKYPNMKIKDIVIDKKYCGILTSFIENSPIIKFEGGWDDEIKNYNLAYTVDLYILNTRQNIGTYLYDKTNKTWSFRQYYNSGEIRKL